MANFVMPFANATLKQWDLMTAARSRSGAHASYTGGFKSEKSQFKLYFPSTFGARFAFTLIFQYDGPHTDLSSLTLAHEKKPTETYLNLGFSDTYSLDYYRDKEKQMLKLNDINTPPKGLHVLEFRTENSHLMVWLEDQFNELADMASITSQVNLDGELVFPPASVYRDTDPMRIFSSGPEAGSKFVFWESHFTATDYFVQFNPSFAYNQENVRIRSGGYISIQAKWTRDTDIQIFMKLVNISMIKTLRSTGETGILIKVYSNGFAIGYSNTSTGGVMDYTLKNIPLDTFHVEPLPISVIDFTIVTGNFI